MLSGSPPPAGGLDSTSVSRTETQAPPPAAGGHPTGASSGWFSRSIAALSTLAMAGALLYLFLPAGPSRREPPEPHGENGEPPRDDAPTFSSEGWQYETICPARALERYRLRLDLSRREGPPAPGDEFRLLLERRDESSFVCLRWAGGRLELFRVESGRRVELRGRSSCDLAAAELVPEAGKGAPASGSLVVDRSPGLWAVLAGGRELITAAHPAASGPETGRPGDIAWGSSGGWTLTGRALQPVEPICFEDRFARDSFNEHGSYEVWYGEWSLESAKDAQRTANAFRLRARSAKPGRPAVASFGHDFWRAYRLEASLRFQAEGAAGLLFAVNSRRHFGLVRWRRPPSTREGETGRLEVVEVDREAPGASGAGSDEIRDRVLLELPWSPRRDQWYRVAVSLFAERGELDVNGRREVFELPPGLRAGRCGLYANSTEGVVFDDILVRSHDSYLARAGDAVQPWEGHGNRGRLRLPERGPAFVRASFAGAYPALRLRWRGSSGSSARVAIDPLFSWGSITSSSLSGSDQFGTRSVVFGLGPGAVRGEYRIELREGECSVSRGTRRLASVAIPEAREGGLDLVSGLGGGWPRLAEIVLGPLAPLPALRQKTKAFSEISVSQGQEAAEFKWIGFVGWLEDRSSWERSPSGDLLRCRTPLWGALEAEAALSPPQEGKRAQILLEPEREGAPASGVRVAREGNALVVADAAGSELARMAAPADGARLKLSLRRAGGVLEGRVRVSQGDSDPPGGQSASGDAAVLRVPFDTGRAPVRVAVGGEKVSPGQLTIRAASVDESLFESAPTEWVRWRGYCDIAPKWQCDPRWTFMGVWSDSIDEKRDAAGIVSRASYFGDQELLFYFSFKDVLGGRNNRRYVRRDLNFAFACPGEDPGGGYCVLLGGFDNRGTQLLRRGAVVAETDKFRLPPYQGRVEDVHWVWYVLRVQRRGGLVRVLIDDREVLSWTDPEPLPGGHVGVWTVGNGMILGRTRFSAERRGPVLAGFDLGGRSEPAGAGWRSFASDRPPRVSATPSGAARVTNAVGGGRFAAVFEREGPARLALAFRAPGGVEVAAYAEKGSSRRRVAPEGAKWLPADGAWHALGACELAEGERLAIGCHDAEGYAAAGIGANGAGSWYEVKAFDSVEQAEAFVAAQLAPTGRAPEF